ncbi:MAG: tetratricopeptide repeat protein [Planctomycetota bacterium]|nr:tetratricopeptide repeat protein [Planctomycetota bacterium]MDP6988719.1 tetratricopeptide repeat protein [Planctomycetota bacterium]
MSCGRAVAGVLALAAGLGCAGEPTAAPAVPEIHLSDAEPRVRAAIEEARAAVAAAPDSAHAWGRLGMVCDAHERNAAAEVCYGRARALDPDDFRWPYHLARVRGLSGADPAEVADLFREALARRPDHAAGHFRLGRVLANAGDLEGACAAYERAVELDAGFALARRGLGQALLALDRPREALVVLAACAALAPSDGATRLAVAAARRRLGEPIEVGAQAPASLVSDRLPLVDPARRAVQELGVSTLHFRLRGRAHVEGGRFAQALPLLALAREGAPEDAGLLRLQARALAETGRGEVALDALAASLELDPDSVEAHLLAGRLQESLGRHDEAALAYARAIDLEPRAGEAYVLRANALARAGRGREAAAVYERAAVHGVGGADLQKNWGTVLHGLGDVPGALARYERAVELAPEDADAHGNLGAILEELGRADEALRHYRRAVELQADHPARERLERLGG